LRIIESVGAIGISPLDAARSNSWNYHKQHSFSAMSRFGTAWTRGRSKPPIRGEYRIWRSMPQGLRTGGAFDQAFSGSASRITDLQ
jgi:hypothetical protein